MIDESNKGIFKSLDWLTIGCYMVLLIWGWFSVCGASYNFAHPNVFGFESNSGKQMIWVITSFVLAGAILLIEKRFFATSAYAIYFIMLFLLLVTIVIAPDTKGSRSWIPIGPVKLQPAEFAKFAVALALGKYMERLNFSMANMKEFVRAAAIIVTPMILIIGQKETGSALVYLSFFLVMYRQGMTGAFLFSAFSAIVYFVVGVRYSQETFENMPTITGEFWVLFIAQLFTIGMTWVFLRSVKVVKLLAYVCVGSTIVAYLFSAFVIPFDVSVILLWVNLGMVGYLLYCGWTTRAYKYFMVALFAFGSTCIYYGSDYVLNNVLREHQRTRIQVLFGLKSEIRGAGYNVRQAEIAIGSGGLAGKGFLKGTQTKLKYVPEQDTDFIFCTVGEEEGFIGSVGVLITYLFLILRLYYLAERQNDILGRVYGYSVASIFLFHLFINVGMVLGLTPVIGIPLPFFSYGGSSLWGFTLLLFIFLRMDAERNVKSA